MSNESSEPYQSYPEYLIRDNRYYSINPGSGVFVDYEPFKKPFPPRTYDELSEAERKDLISKQQRAFAIPESLSSAREGFEQQTFLGASIQNLSINAGFGDSASTLSVDLVEDEYNTSDGSGLGVGVDIYHNGKKDIFAPPFTGSPVFFNFGKRKVSIEESHKKVYDDLYYKELTKGIQNPSDINQYKPYSFGSKGNLHLNFGGILQSFVQNRGTGGNPLYSVQVVDPREILSNVVLILNNYTGTTFNNANMFNLYGFLEFNPSEKQKKEFERYSKVPLQKKIDNVPDSPTFGNYFYYGNDMMYLTNLFSLYNDLKDDYSIYNNKPELLEYFSAITDFPFKFPITGTGFSRRGPQGIPYYRIRQALSSLLGLDGKLPSEYIVAGFGGYINFRGYNYIVDLSGLKKVPDYYFFDFDQITMLDFCLEICDITSSELFVTLLPITNHPVSRRFYEHNLKKTKEKKFNELIAGIIRIDSIDKSFQPEYGAIKKYIDNLQLAGTPIENRDVGYELSNITTDKFVVGAQEVDLYFFSSQADRDTIEVKKAQAAIGNRAQALLSEQWTYEESLTQQILPFYGFLGNGVVSIPKGFGSYQQIMLDSSAWNVNGVGNYYIATEMELRAALISFERWSEFLIRYNDLYMESVETNDAIEGATLSQTAARPEAKILPSLSNSYAVTVPRSVFTSDNNNYGPDNLPVNVCNPPYGYPLYYKRATRLGIQGAGLSDITGNTTRILTNLASIRGGASTNATEYQKQLNTAWASYEAQMNTGNLSNFDIQFINLMSNLLSDPKNLQNGIGLIDSFANGLAPIINIQNRLSKKTSQNALQVYNFIRQVADENLGKKFLVKIPQEANVNYSPIIKVDPLLENVGQYSQGPFGFRPRFINSDLNYESSYEFEAGLITAKSIFNQKHFIKSFLTPWDQNASFNSLTRYKGALSVNFNPILDKYEFNYEPVKQGGFLNFDLLSNLINQQNSLAIKQGLVPQDLTNFIDENSRISAYARFDNSQILSFDLIGQDSFSQQVVNAGYFVPDVSEVLENTSTEDNKFERFPNEYGGSEKLQRPKSIAFVKCDLDERLYLIPPNSLQTIDVHGCEVKDIGKFSLPSKVYDPVTCEKVNSYSFYEAQFVPTPPKAIKSVTKLDFIRDSFGRIEARQELLDTKHVYALITLPGRILPIADARFRDGMFQQKNAQYIKHFLTIDVVKLPEFQEPNYLGGPDTNLLQQFSKFIDPKALGSAVQAFQKALDNLDFAFPNRIDATMPSPVYPDLVALPLLSRERCYGPWISSQIDGQAARYANIGGKIEFIKDENLAPWNFNGYDLMNQAGILQAEFSNSLLLSTERGGFVFPDAPSGLAVGKFLQNAGPLVTNITVDISSDGIKTTCKMDLYTASFGKLQKQKQDLISNISRERQKAKDERNALIRKGLGKGQKSTNFNIIYQQLKNQLIKPQQDYGQYDPSPPADMLIGQANQNSSTKVPGEQNYGNTGATNFTQTNYSVSTSNSQDYINMASNFPDNFTLSQKYYQTASSQWGDIFKPVSLAPNNPYMPSVQYTSPETLKEFYAAQDGVDVSKAV